jgi:hypothetical protein
MLLLQDRDHQAAATWADGLAGLYPAAVICEIMNDDGTMARVPDLVPFAQRHGLKIGTIEDLISFRLRNDRIVKPVARKAVESAFGGGFELVVYETTVDAVEHLLGRGQVAGRHQDDDPVARALEDGRLAEGVDLVHPRIGAGVGKKHEARIQQHCHAIGH